MPSGCQLALHSYCRVKDSCHRSKDLDNFVGVSQLLVMNHNVNCYHIIYA